MNCYIADAMHRTDDAIRWQAFAAVCARLRAGLLGAASPPAIPIAWELTIEVASYHYVTTALAWCLRGEAEVPPDVRDYFTAVLALNAERNENLLAELARIAHALNAIDIEPVLLKGAAHLVGGLYPSPAFRIVGDLDLLVPAQRASAAEAALKRIGFVPASFPAWIETDGYELPKLRHDDEVAGVDLHTGLTDDANAAIIPLSWFCAGTRPVFFRGARLHLADATRSVAHNIVHDQLNHGRHRRNYVELRQLLDLALIRARDESAIDWAALGLLFGRAGAGPVLSTYLAYAQSLFGQPLPKLRENSPAAALDRLRRTVERPAQRWSDLSHLATSYLGRLRRNPAGFLNLFNLRTWPGRTRLIMNALKAPKW